MIGIVAIDSDGRCVHLRVSAADNCSPTLEGTDGEETVAVRYSRAGVAVSKVLNRARISIPNCDKHRLVMWVTCVDQKMLRFDLRRVELTPSSHGLLGEDMFSYYLANW